MFWFLWALCASLCAAALAESNRIFKLDPQYLNAWRSTFATILVAFAIPYMAWPSGESAKWFYVVSGLDGAVTAIGMVMFFYLAARKTGRVSSMILPLAAIGAYLMWWMIQPSERPDLMNHPGRVITAVLSAAVILVALQRVRDNDASWESFLFVLPIGFMFGVFDALTKYVLGTGYNLYALALTYAFMELAACTVVSWIATIPTPIGGRQIGVFDKKLLWGGFWCAFWTCGMVLCSIFSISQAPNPALPGLVMALTPVWLFALNTLRRIKDDVSVPASAMLVAGAVGLLISTIPS